MPLSSAAMPSGGITPRTSCEPAIGRHETGGLLVPRQHQLDLRVPQRLQHVEILLAGDGEDVLRRPHFRARHQEIGAPLVTRLILPSSPLSPPALAEPSPA